MKPLRYCLPLFVAAWLGLMLSGCISNKYKAASAINAQPLLMHLNLGGEIVNVQLDTVIVYQGPGTWKKAAYWDEFVVTLTNRSEEGVSVTGASLVDFAGLIVPVGENPWLLEKASLSQRDRYTKAGVNFALNTLGYVTYTGGMVGAGMVIGAATSSTWGGVAAGATVGLIAVPVTAIVIYANNQKHKHEIEREFDRRRLFLPLPLAPSTPRTGSLFFPMTVSPRILRIEWARDDEHGIIELPLPMLAGMHRKEGPDKPQ